MNIEQILAIVIFAAMFIAIMSGKVHRYIPALIGAALTSILILILVEPGPEKFWQVLRLDDFIDPHWWYGKEAVEASSVAHEGPEIGGINWQTIVFIGGMMTMVEGLGAVGFFRWLCLRLAKLVNYQVIPILITFMLLSGFLSMFIDSITVLLFLAVVTCELARLLKFDPVPVIIAEIFAANTGGSATMSGDPPNIVIGTALNYTFADFAANTAPIAWIGMLVTLGLFYLFFRKILSRPSSNGSAIYPNKYPEPREAITNPRLFKINTAIFILVVILIVTHAESGLSVALIGCIAASITLLAARRQATHIIKGVDWRTLLFFFGLFICVGGLEATGVLKELADYIGEASGGKLVLVIPFILWISAFASAIVDNIPFAATMVPVIKNLALNPNLKLPVLAWTLALGTDIGGNATPIGASANVVGTAIADREGYPVSWRRFCKYALPAMIIVVALCHLYLVVRYT
jgi:Na+/H+ antiporter NhaD/arsenite permease-like protein